MEYEYHIAAFFLGFLLDMAFGDPQGMPHPVRLMGKMTAWMEKRLREGKEDGKTGREKAELRQGLWLAFFVPVITAAVAGSLLMAAYWIHPYAGMAVEAFMTYQTLAAKCLKTESMKVYRHLKDGDRERARAAVSMIVGRDTECLDEEGIVKAAVETVAENASDGVVAPMLYLAAGGPALGFFYKAVNTMDSMVGYKNEKYLYFGRAAAKLDDAMNFLPARVCAWLMIAIAFLPGKCFSGKRAFAVWREDRGKHASPNSAQTESVCAGALGIRLAGDASYFGRTIRKPYIGKELRKVEYEDIRRANQLMYSAAWLCEILCLLLMAGIALAV